MIENNNDVGQLEEQPSYSQEEADFIASLGTESADYNGDVSDAANDDDIGLQQAAGAAVFALDKIEFAIKQFGHKDFAWQKEEKDQTAMAVAPALIKHGGELPPWLEPYKEEAFALVAVGALAFGGYMQVKALKELDQAKEKQDLVSDDEVPITNAA